MKIRLLSFIFGVVFWVTSCNVTQYTTIEYKPAPKKYGYNLTVPLKFERTCIMAENDYCYMFEYSNVDSTSATIYIHYCPLSFLVDVVPDLVRKFYGDSVFCKYYDAELSEEDSPTLYPLYNQQTIDSVLRSLECSDTLIFWGNDDLYAWKEIRIDNKIAVGYFNVPIKKSKMFDKTLFSLQLTDSTRAIDSYRNEIINGGD